MNNVIEWERICHCNVVPRPHVNYYRLRNITQKGYIFEGKTDYEWTEWERIPVEEFSTEFIRLLGHLTGIFEDKNIRITNIGGANARN